MLALAVLMSGFYMARMFRVPESARGSAEAIQDEPTTEPSTLGKEAGTPPVSDQLPVAALVDVDRAATAAVEDPARFGTGGSADELVSDGGRRPLSGPPTVRKKEKVEEAPEGRQRRPSYDAAVPDFAADYQPWLDPLEQTEQTASNQDSRGDTLAFSRDKPAAEKHGAPEQAQGEHLLRHRIVEGDTLRQLAAQYLGDRERYLELYEANQDVLFHPRLLPIGIDIVIPDQPDRFAADGINQSEDLTAQRDAWDKNNDSESAEDSSYSPWDEY
jgi:nucleoid-associated protein YgaU